METLGILLGVVSVLLICLYIIWAIKKGGYAALVLVRILVRVGAILLIGGVLTWLGSTAREPFVGFLTWLGEQGPWPSSYQPHCALLSFFVIFRLALAPLLLTHVRVNRETGEVKEWHPLEGLTLWLFAVVLELWMFWFTTQAVVWRDGFWVGAQNNIFFASLGGGGKFLVALIMYVAVLAVLAVLTPIIIGVGSGYLGFLADECWSHGWWYEVLFVFPVLGYLFFRYYQSPFLLTIFFCFLLVRLISVMPLRAISGLLNWRNDMWVEKLGQQLVGGESAEVRLEAVKKLKCLGEWAAPVGDKLAVALKDSDEQVRELAKQAAVPALRGALTMLGVPVLIAALTDSDSDVRRSAAEALGKIGGPVVPALIAALSNHDVQLSAFKVLDERPAFRAALRDSDSDVCRRAAEVLDKLDRAGL